jgi:hypothetical protein
LNLRPSGPQPDALPGCATPRAVQFTRRAVLQRCEHMFDDGARTSKVRTVRSDQAGRRLQLATHRTGPARQPLPGVSRRLPPRALLRQPEAVRRPGTHTQAGARLGADEVSDRVLRGPPMRRLRGGAPDGARVRPPSRHGIQHRVGTAVSQLAVGPRRDRQMRGRSAPIATGAGRCVGWAPFAPYSRQATAKYEAGDGTRTRDRSLEGSSVTATPRPRGGPV